MIRDFSNHAKFCEHLTIRTKEGITVPYRSSPAGAKLSRSIRKQELAGVPIRQAVLKSAQVWMTSSALVEIFRRIPFFPGRRALVLADSEDHANLIFGYFRQYMESYAQNPCGAEFDSAILLPDLVSDTEGNIRWANDSSALVHTAYNVDVGRSAPFNWALLSEAAFYRDMATLMTGLMERVPTSPDSGVIIESTANGMGGDFYDLCQRAMDPRRSSGWAFVFFGYHEHPENRMRPEPGFKITREELAEQQKYNLHVNQIAWRRYKIETSCEGKIERFRQEHPGNPQEAFQSSGRTIFDMQAVGQCPRFRTHPRAPGSRPGGARSASSSERAKMRGELVVYKMPQVRGRYIIGADHAEGIDPDARKGAGSSDLDYRSATAFNVDTGEEMAKLKERTSRHRGRTGCSGWGAFTTGRS